MSSDENGRLLQVMEDLTQELRSARAEEALTRHLAKFAALGPEKVVEFWYCGCVPIKFFVPKAYLDIVQTHMMMSESFWDQATLEAFSPYIRGKNILDIGANVGSHSVFWGKIAGAKSIVAFEPIPETFEILRRNIELNQLTKVVKIHPFGLGERETTGDPWSEARNRMHAIIRAREDRAGAIKLRPLDGLSLAPFDFAKIDVEGHTEFLLKGAKQTLARFKPSLYVELWVSERPQNKQILESYGYEVLGSVEDSNYIFVHKDRSDEAEKLRPIINGPWTL
ncbi:FkbM family methyltransferase [Methylobacterium sp. E-065]|uniref:FkbM family methyltransferase n=1 Tax=Methylobacterium sp. E-065 TaxID=2836583 RepID=UPI001FB879A5|nr:FkbM family methyltransferase [Methylobacterium sp. E-065]MCJ2020546.1 FkbM family methyltransferase [Methylobacterium sp. E-065]